VEALERLQSAQKPVLIAGIEVHRFGLQKWVLQLAEKYNIPMCATLLGKSVVSEKHPLYLGIYEGAMGRKEVTEYVESSDCVVLLGAFMTDINLGIFTAHLEPGRCISATSEKLRIGHHHFHDVLFEDFLIGLTRLTMKPKKKTPLPTRVSSPIVKRPASELVDLSDELEPIEEESTFAGQAPRAPDPRMVAALRDGIEEDVEALLQARSPRFYRPVGCEQCAGTGYRGRVAIAEILVIDDPVRNEILNQSDAVTIQRVATSRGMRTLREDGARLVVRGITSLAEVLAATQLAEIESESRVSAPPNAPRAAAGETR